MTIKSYKQIHVNISIKKIMDKDHQIIHKLLNKFEKELNHNFKKSKNTFNKLKWTLEKHFFIEEKIIFNLYLSLTHEENDYINQLLMEHEKIIWLLNEMEEKFSGNLKPDIAELTQILIAHSRFEDNFFYPKLDEEIPEREKLRIFERIEEENTN